MTRQLQPCCSPRVHTPSYVLTLETEMPVMREYDGACGSVRGSATGSSPTNSPNSLNLQADASAKVAPVAVLLQAVRTVCHTSYDADGFALDSWGDE